jgi:hypothetical protein
MSSRYFANQRAWQLLTGHEVAPVAAALATQIAVRGERQIDVLGMRLDELRKLLVGCGAQPIVLGLDRAQALFDRGAVLVDGLEQIAQSRMHRHGRTPCRHPGQTKANELRN